MESAVSFAPLRPVGFVNFTGRGKDCFLRGGATCFSAGRGRVVRGEHPWYMTIQKTINPSQNIILPPRISQLLLAGTMSSKYIDLINCKFSGPVQRVRLMMGQLIGNYPPESSTTSKLPHGSYGLHEF